MTFLYVFLGILLIGLFGFVLVVTLRVFGYRREVDQSMKHCNTRVVECPETGRPAAVDATANTDGGFHVEQCSRWPERGPCDHGCVPEIVEAPEESLLPNILTKWYDGKSCAVCGMKLSEVHWFDFKPPLMGPDGEITQWYDVSVEDLSSVLSTHRPICAECYDESCPI